LLRAVGFQVDALFVASVWQCYPAVLGQRVKLIVSHLLLSQIIHTLSFTCSYKFLRKKADNLGGNWINY